MNYLLPTGSFFVQTAAESYRLFRTYHKGTGKPVRPITTNGVGNGWSPYNTDGAVWMCEKSAMTIDEGTWGDVIRIKGEDGIPGPMGNRGPLPVPAGIFDIATEYKCTSATAQFIWYEEGKSYYVLNKEGSFKGINPAKDYATNGLDATWIPFENYKAVVMEMAFIRFGLLGSAVFWDDYMFSQQGVDKDGNITSDYSGFGGDNFSPNFQVNFKTGELQCYNANIQGFLKRKSTIVEDKFQIIITPTFNIYHIKSDLDSVAVLFFAPSTRSNDYEFDIYNNGLGTVTVVPPTNATMFLWRGRVFERVYLDKAGTHLSGIWGPVTKGISQDYPTMFIIKNSADFFVDGKYLKSL